MDLTVAGVAVTYQPDDEQLGIINVELAAFDGEVGMSQIPLPDPTNTLSVVTGRRVLLRETAIYLLDGFIFDFDRDRGPIPVSTNIVKTVSVEDPNAVLRGFRTKKVRPAEYDYQRVRAFYQLDKDTKLHGSNITDISWVLSTDPVRMGKKSYENDQGWADLISDLVESTGKTLFVHDKADGGRCLHYHALTEGHTSGLSITDVPASVNGVTVFAPGSPQRNRTAADLANDVAGVDSKGRRLIRLDTASRTAHDVDGRRHEALVSFDTADEDDLHNKVVAYLAAHRYDQDTYNVTIGPLDSEALNRIRVGDLITVTSTVLDLSASVERISHMTLTVFRGKDGKPAPGLWDARLELGAPARAGGSPRGGGSTPISNPVPSAPFTPPATQTIAAQAILVMGTAVSNTSDATWNYPGGSPAGRLTSGNRYMLRLEVITNRQIPDLSADDDHYWDHSWGGFAGYVVESADNPTIGAVTGWSDASGLVDANLDEDAMAADGSPAHIIPDPYLIGTGSSFVTQWETYTGSTVDIDLAMSGSVLSGFDGADTTARLTLYERDGNGNPIVPDEGPAGGQAVVNDEDVEGGDGSTVTGNTLYPYVPGSLHITVNGQDWTPYVNETDPASGAYTFDFPPPAGATIIRDYQAGQTVTTEPSTETEPVLTLPPVDSGTVAGANALQNLIDAASSGDVIDVPFRSYREDITIDKPLTLRGNGSTIDAQSSRSMWVTVTANDVTIQDFWMINAAADAASAEKTPQEGSIRCTGYDRLTLINVHTRVGRDCNLRLQDSANTLLRGSSFNDAPRSGGTIGSVPGLRIIDCQFNDNKTNATYSALWEGGGYKIGGSESTNILIERTEASGNNGVGQWIDEHPSNVTMRDCWGDHNDYSGLMYEIATGGTIVRFRSWENGWGDARGDDPSSGDWGWGAGILISSAGTVNVVDSISAWDSAGITRINQGDRSNREQTVRLVGDGNFVAGDTGRRISSWHQDGSGNQILTTDPSNYETDLSYYTVGTPFFNWDGDVTAVAFAATRGGQGLTLLSAGAKTTLLAAADVGGVASVGIPTSPEPH